MNAYIVITVLSFDGENKPEKTCDDGRPLACAGRIYLCGESSGSDCGIMTDGNYVLNPTDEELRSEINLSVAGTQEAVTMVEAGAREVSEEIMLEPIVYGHERIKEICQEQEKFLSQFEVKNMNLKRLKLMQM